MPNNTSSDFIVSLLWTHVQAKANVNATYCGINCPKRKPQRFAVRRCSEFVSRLNRTHFRFGSKADICGANRHVRFTPNSDRESGFPQKLMSALPLKADMCSAVVHVRFGPKADIKLFIRLHRRVALTAREAACLGSIDIDQSAFAAGAGLALLRRGHSVTRLTGTIDCALNHPRSFRLLNKLAHISEPRVMSLWNHKRGKIGAIAFLKYARAR